MNFAEPVKAISILRIATRSRGPISKWFGVDKSVSRATTDLRNGRLDWRSRGAAVETRVTAIRLMSERLSPTDAAAFWWTRNQLDFQQHVESDEDIQIIRFGQACNSPKNIAEALSDFAGIALPARSIDPERVHGPKAS
jgi:hypothetical protein